jgi:alpha-amylase
MAAICFYFQVHQPYRLKNYSFFKIGKDHAYEATAQNVEILNRVSDLCYLPANAMMYKLIQENEGRFKITYSITGTCIEQLHRHRPDVIDSFRRLAETGCVEFLSETYYHSLASLYSPTEFVRQVKLHEKAMQNILGVKTKVFRNTELMYQNGLADLLDEMGYKMVLAEGGRKFLGAESGNQIFQSKNGKTKVLPRNYILSDDIAFRFSDPTWSEYPLLADTFASWLHKVEDPNGCVNLFMDYETFGEHRKQETGIFDFMKHLPKQILKDKKAHFATPSDLLKIKRTKPPGYDSPAWSSWADEDKDASAWTEDHMQRDALRKIYALEPVVLKLGKPDILDVWGKLQTSDHFYYMSTRYRNDATHQSFTPYNSPYDAYLNFMNVLSDFQGILSSGL